MSRKSKRNQIEFNNLHHPDCLCPKEMRVFKFLRDFHEEYGAWPPLKLIAEDLGVKTPHYYIALLKKKGALHTPDGVSKHYNLHHGKFKELTDNTYKVLMGMARDAAKKYIEVNTAQRKRAKKRGEDEK